MLNATDATFERDVIQRSHDVPVVVDLWAEWCGPCRTLGPIIEKVVAETEGRVELVKVDVDANPMVSQAFLVQSIPAVYAIREGKVVDSFVGALPEHAVREWVGRLAPAPSEVDLLVEQGDEASLRKALDIDPDHAGGVVALAELLVSQGSSDEALRLLARIPETAETRRVAAMARVGETVLNDGAADEITTELDTLLERVKADEAARQRFLDLLELLGVDHPRTAEYRKALTARLF